MTTTPSNTVPTDVPHAINVSRDLAYELAATSAAYLKALAEKKEVAQKYTKELKALMKRMNDLNVEIMTSGDTQLVMNFGSKVGAERALAQSAPTGDDDRDDTLLADDEVGADEDGSEEVEDDLDKAIEATH